MHLWSLDAADPEKADLKAVQEAQTLGPVSVLQHGASARSRAATSVSQAVVESVAVRSRPVKRPRPFHCFNLRFGVWAVPSPWRAETSGAVRWTWIRLILRQLRQRCCFVN